MLLRRMSVRRVVVTTATSARPSTMLFCLPRLLVCAHRDITVPAHDILVYVT